MANPTPLPPHPFYISPFDWSMYFSHELPSQFFPETRPEYYQARQIEVIDENVTELLQVHLPTVAVTSTSLKDRTLEEEQLRYLKQTLTLEREPPTETLYYKVFLSTDGAKLTRLFYDKELMYRDNEILLFVEVNDGDIFSGSSLYMKVGKTAAAYLKANGRVTEIANSIAAKGVKKEDIIDLIASLNYTESLTDKVLSIFSGVLSATTFVINLPLKAVSTVFGWAADGLTGALRIEEHFWNPDHKLYQPTIENGMAVFFDAARKGIEKANGYLRTIDGKLQMYDLGILSPIKYVVAKARELLNGLPAALDAVASIANAYVQFRIALVCGIWNAIVELITGILGFVKLLADLVVGINNAKAEFVNDLPMYLDLALEYLDNFWQALQKIDITEVVKSMASGFVGFMASLSDAVAAVPGKIGDYLSSINAAELGYFIGYVAANIAEFFIPVLKVAKLAKAGKLAAAFDEFVAGLARATDETLAMTNKMGRAMANKMLLAIDGSIALMRQGTPGIKVFIKNFFEQLKRWLDELAGNSQKHLDELARKKMDDINKVLLKNRNRYDPNKPALKKLGIKIPVSANGLAPDFAKTRYLYPISGQQKNIVKIKLTGNRDKDITEAFRKAGIDETVPNNHTWHHLDDFDPVNGEATMQLAETFMHQQTYPHLGSVKQYEIFYNKKYT